MQRKADKIVTAQSIYIHGTVSYFILLNVPYFKLNREHEEFGYCQAGTSSTLLEDGTLILGSPGPYTWRGTIFIIDTSEDFLKRDQHVYLAPYSQTTSPVDKYSYLG